MSSEETTLSALFNDFMQSASQVLQEYSVVSCALSGRKCVLLSPQPQLPQRRRLPKAKPEQAADADAADADADSAAPQTEEERENIVVLAASRSKLDFHSKSFIKGLSRKLRGMKRNEIVALVDRLSAAGKLRGKEQSEQ